MNIKIVINKLGPIVDSTIEVKPFMVFTGESGLGKSYTALLVYNLVTSLTLTRLQDFIDLKLRDGKKNICFKFKDYRVWLNQNTSSFMGYLLGNNDFFCDVNYIFDIDDDSSIELNVLDTEEAKISRCSINGQIETYPFDLPDSLLMGLTLSGFLARMCLGASYLNSLILPPARAAFMGANTTSPIGMYRDFLRQLDDLKTPSQTANPDMQFFLSYITKLADGNIVLENGSVFLQFDSGEKIPISAAASSVKELMPFLLMLQNSKSLYNSLLFEEPEAHVHPLKQFLVMDMLTRCCNKKMMIQMTTHSDYLLGRMNQLILLGKIRKVSMPAFEKFCADYHHNKNLYLDGEQVGAYYFERVENRVVIKQQDTECGLPFTTFEKAVKGQIALSSELEDLAESLGITINCN